MSKFVRPALQVSLWLFTLLPAVVQAQDFPFERVADRINATLPPPLPVDLPDYGGQFEVAILAGMDFLREDLPRWRGYGPNPIGALSMAEIKYHVHKDVYLRGFAGYSYALTATSWGAQVGYQVLPGSFDDASLSFSLGLADSIVAQKHALLALLSGHWSLELDRSALRRVVLRQVLLVGLDIGLVLYEPINRSFGFTPIRIGAGWMQTFDPMRMQIYFDGTKEGAFRLIAGFQYRFVPSDESAPNE